MKVLSEKIEKLASQAALENDCLLYDIEFKNKTLIVFIEKEKNAVSLDDCAQVSQSLGELLDKEEPIKTSYNLEVSSPGVEKVLRKPWHFEKSLGKNIKINMNDKYKGDRYFEGHLSCIKDNNLILKKGQTTHSLPLNFVHKGKVVFPKNHQEKRGE